MFDEKYLDKKLLHEKLVNSSSSSTSESFSRHEKNIHEIKEDGLRIESKHHKIHDKKPLYLTEDHKVVIPAFKFDSYSKEEEEAKRSSDSPPDGIINLATGHKCYIDATPRQNSRRSSLEIAQPIQRHSPSTIFHDDSLYEYLTENGIVVNIDENKKEERHVTERNKYKNYRLLDDHKTYHNESMSQEKLESQSINHSEINNHNFENILKEYKSIIAEENTISSHQTRKSSKIDSQNNSSGKGAVDSYINRPSYSYIDKHSDNLKQTSKNTMLEQSSTYKKYSQSSDSGYRESYQTSEHEISASALSTSYESYKKEMDFKKRSKEYNASAYRQSEREELYNKKINHNHQNKSFFESHELFSGFRRTVDVLDEASLRENNAATASALTDYIAEVSEEELKALIDQKRHELAKHNLRHKSSFRQSKTSTSREIESSNTNTKKLSKDELYKKADEMVKRAIEKGDLDERHRIRQYDYTNQYSSTDIKGIYKSESHHTGTHHIESSTNIEQHTEANTSTRLDKSFNSRFKNSSSFQENRQMSKERNNSIDKIHSQNSAFSQLKREEFHRDLDKGFENVSDFQERRKISNENNYIIDKTESYPNAFSAIHREEFKNRTNHKVRSISHDVSREDSFRVHKKHQKINFQQEKDYASSVTRKFHDSHTPKPPIRKIKQSEENYINRKTSTESPITKNNYKMQNRGFIRYSNNKSIVNIKAPEDFSHSSSEETFEEQFESEHQSPVEDHKDTVKIKYVIRKTTENPPPKARRRVMKYARKRRIKIKKKSKSISENEESTISSDGESDDNSSYARIRATRNLKHKTYRISYSKPKQIYKEKEKNINTKKELDKHFYIKSIKRSSQNNRIIIRSSKNKHNQKIRLQVEPDDSDTDDPKWIVTSIRRSATKTTRKQNLLNKNIPKSKIHSIYTKPKPRKKKLIKININTNSQKGNNISADNLVSINRGPKCVLYFKQQRHAIIEYIEDLEKLKQSKNREQISQNKIFPKKKKKKLRKKRKIKEKTNESPVSEKIEQLSHFKESKITSLVEEQQQQKSKQINKEYSIKKTTGRQISSVQLKRKAYRKKYNLSSSDSENNKSSPLPYQSIQHSTKERAAKSSKSSADSIDRISTTAQPSLENTNQQVESYHRKLSNKTIEKSQKSSRSSYKDDFVNETKSKNISKRETIYETKTRMKSKSFSEDLTQEKSQMTEKRRAATLRFRPSFKRERTYTNQGGRCRCGINHNHAIVSFIGDRRIKQQFKMAANENSSSQEKEYQISTHTGVHRWAGTDANIYVTMIGTKGKGKEHKLKGKGKLFEKGCIDSFTVKDQDLGFISKIHVRNDNKGIAPGWLLNKVVVKEDEKENVFSYGNWLYKGKNYKIEDDIEVDGLPVVGIDPHIEYNSEQHHTDKFKMSEDNPAIILRRGQTFKITLFLARDYKPESDPFSFTLMTTKKPQQMLNTLVTVNEVMPKDFNSVKKRGKEWAFKICEITDPKVIDVEIFIPPTAIPAKYTVYVNDEDGVCYEPAAPVYILFNPWCPEDDVYMENEEELKEYVMRQTGKIYVGSSLRPRGRNWHFGQFEEISLTTSMKMLDEMKPKNRHSPVHVSRFLTSKVNSIDNCGVLEGNWSGEYDDGHRPTSWISTTAILEQYAEKELSVKYGQCWVFSAVITGVMRCLGIPCRSVTNFSSAHDSDGSCSNDTYIDENGEEIEEMSSDSVWNFHVWNDAWMARPDLPPGYGGWQAIDATPQERSQGVFQMGPAPLAAVKEGDVDTLYDVGFVLAEVNADSMIWEKNKESEEWEVIYRNKTMVGKLVCTKAVGKQKMLDITECYKFREGSVLERASVRNALLKTKNPAVKTTRKDISLEIVPLKKHINVGGDITIDIKIVNESEDEHPMSVMVGGQVIRYDGVAQAKLEMHTEETTIEKSAEKKIRIKVPSSHYMPYLSEETQVRFVATGKVSDTLQFIRGEEIIDIVKPDLVVEKCEDKLRSGVESEMLVTFENPLDVELTGCKMYMDGTIIKNRIYFNNMENVPANGKMEQKILFVPENTAKERKDKKANISFSSKELGGVSIQHIVSVSPPCTCVE